MEGDERGRVWIPTGVIGAMALGVALIPLRGVTSASNLAFAFVALVIVVAEFGGRAAALVTAVVSAMSFNFFLTEPIAANISKTDHTIAFVGMALCGLIAAAFGTRRARSAQSARRVRDDLVALRRVLKPLEAAASPAAALGELRLAFGLGRVALRGADDQVLAVSPEGTDRSRRAAVGLDAETLFALDGLSTGLAIAAFACPRTEGTSGSPPSAARSRCTCGRAMPQASTRTRGRPLPSQPPCSRRA